MLTLASLHLGFFISANSQQKDTPTTTQTVSRVFGVTCLCQRALLRWAHLSDPTFAAVLPGGRHL